MIENKQFFLFRLPSTFLKSYTEKLAIGEDRVSEVVFDRLSTNQYREDIKFRQKLMSSTYKIRFTRLSIGKNEDGEDSVELLMSNLPNDEYSIGDLRDLYHLRWAIETSYNRLKNRMKLEEFSGFKPVLIYQDIYADVWLYNLISLELIYMNEKVEIEQKEKGDYGNWHYEEDVYQIHCDNG